MQAQNPTFLQTAVGRIALVIVVLFKD